MQEKFLMFENRFYKVFKHFSKIARNQQISCFRIYDKDLPEFPLIIEKYEDSIYVAEYKSNHSLSEEAYENWLITSLQIISKVSAIAKENIHLKQRKRIVDRKEQYQKLNEKKELSIVKESGLQFKINLTDFLDTGLFLDHRITRKMVKEESNRKKVLNLFCYTGSFSVYAAAGNADEVWSIDLSNTYIDWAKENMELNGLFDEQKHFFIKADVIQYLPKLINDYFDIIILDPPTFSNSKMMKDVFDVQRDHVELINQLLTKTNQHGVIYFSNNFTKFQIDKDKIKSSQIKDITRQTTPFDFDNKLKRVCFKIWK